MKILIGTPAYGGLVTTEYLVSMVTTTRGFIRDKVDFTLYTMANESLINRGRNGIAHAALEGGYDKLVFIDADIGWTYDDICNLLNSKQDIIGGTYPMKTYPLTVNFNAMPEHAEIFAHNTDKGKLYRKTMDKFAEYKARYADKNGEVQVIHVPTGFMSIKVAVFRHLQDKVATYQNVDLNTGAQSTIHEFFPVRIKNNALESEDWAFCSIAREHGIAVHLNTKIVTKHVGTHIFQP